MQQIVVTVCQMMTCQKTMQYYQKAVKEKEVQTVAGKMKVCVINSVST